MGIGNTEIYNFDTQKEHMQWGKKEKTKEQLMTKIFSPEEHDYNYKEVVISIL